MNDYRRARKPEQKEERRLHLLETARAFLREGGDARALGLNELARRASMAKSNVYRYFETREAVLLALLWDEWESWFRELDAAEQRPPSYPCSLEALTAFIARTIAARPLLGQLTSLLPSVLEHNLSESAIIEFKTGTIAFFRGVAGYLAERAPELRADEYERFIHDAVTLITGLYPYSYPSAAVARAHAHGELGRLAVDYERDLARLLLAVGRAHLAARVD
ncbi:MAG TPA: TetR family transcriptional regulator [Polyangiaceae bacterium]|nr:TetR family transcriptional regulator [Polyangiaceae bacterium]